MTQQAPISSGKIASFAKTWLGAGLNLILPPRCPMTGALVGRNGTLAPDYWAKLTFIHDSYCDTCGAPFRQAMTPGMVCAGCLAEPPLFTRARAALRYDDASTAMILKFKHADGTHLGKIFAGWLQQFGGDVLHDADLLIPVPLHRWRLLKRRYNQAALLTTALSVQTGIPSAPHLLRRMRYTASQGHKSKTQRHDNIKAAFTVPENLRAAIKDKNIVLLDDVYTSGATVQECAKTLLKAGARQVSVLTVARVGFAQ